MLLTWLTCAHLWFFYRCICLQRQMIAPRCSQFEQLRTRHCKSAGMSTAMEHAQGARRKGVQFEITMWTFSAWMGTHFSRWISNLFGSVFHRGSRLPSTASSRKTRLKDIKRVKILAGRHKTEIVAQDFVNVSTQQQLHKENMVQSDSSREKVGKRSPPGRLNFAFDGHMKFTFAYKNTSLSRSVRIRLAQGHYQGKPFFSRNNWWIAGVGCKVQGPKTEPFGLICDDEDGKGQVAILSKTPCDICTNSHRFQISTWPR